jgi:NAD(P)-dependent dehydrogenase (short-subunit alcohol dehydrogenase family)
MELNRIMDFSEFINEASSTKSHIVMLIGGGTNEFSRSLEKECKRKGIRVNVLDIDFTEVEISEKGHVIKEGKQTVKIDPASTIIIARSGVLKSTHNKEVLTLVRLIVFIER